MKKLGELTVKLLHAIALAVECAANLYHAVRLGISALTSTIKEQMKQNKQ